MSKQQSTTEFLAAMADVTPLKPSNKVSPQTNKPKINRHKIKQATQPDLVLNPDDLYSTQGVSSNEQLSFIRQGFANPSDLTKFRKGEMRIEARLDLHGYRLDTAQQKLLQFIQSAKLNNRKILLIIHGKGYNSDTDFPALKNLVNQSLQQLLAVQAFVSAVPKDGGTGAVYVWLEQTKPNKTASRNS